MLPSLKPPNKEVDVDFMVFVERYATDLLKWDILTFFGHNPGYCGSTTQIARRIGRSSHAIRPELGDLALLGLLEQSWQDQQSQTVYQLTKEPNLRRLILKFANNQ